ncbi:MAG: fibronectin type III domain-containing protein [Elusimicrobia bacterium]|nr:fibronectin type III domain-containing protein [Elusimicrobiota bacterium]
MSKIRRLIGGGAMSLCCLTWLRPGPVWAAESRVALRGHVLPLARMATRLGRLPTDENVDLGLVVRLDEDLLNQTLAQLYGPNAPAQKRFLSPAEFARKFDLAAKRQKLKDFAQAAGLVVDAAEDRPESQIVKVSGTAGLVEKAFGVQLQRFRGADGRLFRAHETEPLVPASLAAHLRAVSGLSNLRGVMRPHLRRHQPASQPSGETGISSPRAARPSTLTGTGPSGGLAPANIKTIYGLSGALTGSGQTVAVIEFDGYRPGDIPLYESQFSLASPPVTFVSVDGQQNLCGPNQDTNCNSVSPASDGGMIEVALDIELLIALAPGVSGILVYTPPNTTAGLLHAYNKMATDNTAKVISVSWGADIDSVGGAALTAESQIFAQLATQGQSVLAASGDCGSYDQPNGSGGCITNNGYRVDDPASQAYVTGVGGTSLSGTLSPLSVTETTWNRLSAGRGAGGGGIANYVEGATTYWPIPGYQSGVAGKYSTVYRNVPDVALNADPDSAPYSICVGGTCNDTSYYTTLIGGTSAATPLWAALTALANQKLVASGFGVVGFANPSLYQVAGGSYGSTFNDITSGGNGLSGVYQAGTGYDNVTGWGSFKGDALINAIYALSAPASAPQNFTATTLGTSSITWTWDSVAGASSYHVYYSSNTAQLAANVGATRATLDFPPNTVSGVMVKAANAAGEGPGGTSPSTATFALALTSTNSTFAHISSITVSWNTCAANACAGYVLQASPNADFSAPVFSSVTPNYALGRLQVSGLSKLTKYYLRVGTLNWSRGANYYTLPQTTTTLTDLVAPGPGSPEFSGITASAIVFNWTRNGNPYPATYQADCSSMATYVPSTSQSGSELYSATFSNLIPNTSYYFRVRAVGGGAYLNTDPAAPPATLAAAPAAAAVPFAAVYKTSMTVAWSDNGNALDTLYKAEALDSGSTVVTSSVTRNRTATLTGLDKNTLYSARVWALNRTDGTKVGPYAIGSTYTLVDQPVLGLEPFSSLGFDGFTFSFTGNNPSGTRYIVQVTTATGAVTVAASSNTANASASFSGLLSNATYYAAVAALNQAGSPTPFTVAKATATQVATPLPLTSPVTVRSSTTLGFAWGSGTLAPGTTYLAEVSSFSSTFRFGVVSSSTLNTWTLASGLQPNTSYYAQVRARSASSDPDGLPLGLGTLAATLPTPPAAAAFQWVYYTSATAVWKPLPIAPSSTTCEGYRLEVSTSPGFTGVVYSSTVANGVSTAAVDGLAFATAYYARVASLSPEGQPSWLSFGSTTTALPPVSSGTVTGTGALTLVLSTAVFPGLTAVRVSIPAAAFPVGTKISAWAELSTDLYQARSNEVAGLTPFGAGVGIELSAGGLQPNPPWCVALVMGYDSDQVPLGQDQRAMRLFRYDTVAGQWTLESSSKVDVAGRTLMACVSHFSLFAPFFITAASDLSSVHVFPQPWEIGDAASPYWASALQFSNLPADARVRIFTVTGELVDEGTAAGGALSWDGNNRYGHKAASGTYLVSIESGGQKEVRRVVLIR